MDIIVDEEEIRVDKYLAVHTEMSRETINSMIKEGFILVNGKVTKSSYKVKLNDRILIKDGFIKEMNLTPCKMDLDIYYEDEYLIVLNKPSGLVVHPGNGNYDNTLVNGLLAYTTLSNSGDEFRPGIVHRLDKDTSGLMIVCKNDKAHAILADDFKNKKVYREYVALVEGIFPQKSAIIDAPIGRDKENFQKMAIVSSGKKAITHINVIKYYPEYTLLRINLETGRTHQIRVHLSSIGYPVFNDPVYNNKKSTTEFGQFLHSEYLKFIHPITKKELEFRSPLPDEFQKFLDELDKGN